MSGGYFDYEQYKIGQIADQVKHLILTNNSVELDKYGYNRNHSYSEETIAEFKKGLYYLQQAQIYAQRIDWLASDDDNEDSFRERLKQDILELKNE